MTQIDYILRFYHRGQFMKTKYVGGTCTEISELVDADRFSYTVVMDYVKDDLKYIEIGGIYVKKVPNGWKLIANDTDLNEYIQAVRGVNLEFYVDNIVDKSIEPRSQMQPHVIIRPRTQFFEGLLAKRQFVSVQSLQQKRENNRLAGKSTEYVTTNQGKSKQVLSENITDYERKRLLRKQENNEMLESLRLKKLGAELLTKRDKDKDKVKGVDSSLEFDEEYVPGQDSLLEGENDEEEIVSKQVIKTIQIKPHPELKTMTNTCRPTTRSRTITQSITQNASPSPPPSLPVDMQSNLPMRVAVPKKNHNNEGIGSMEAFLEMQKRKRESEIMDNHMDANTHLTSIPQTPGETLENPTDAPKVKKHRGPTLMNEVYTRKPDERKIIKLNSDFQAVTDDTKVVSEFTNFLGTLARQVVPLDCISWHHYPKKQKDDLWNFVKTKYMIPEEGKTFTLRTINALWRTYKSRIKKDHYLEYDNDEDRLRNKPSEISAEEFKVLLKYWGNDEIKRRSKAASENRQKIVETHTTGRTSFAQIGQKIKVEKKMQAHEPVPLDLIYVETRKRMPGRNYKTQIPASEDQRNGDSLKIDSHAHTIDDIKKSAHGPNWLLGRSGKSRKTKMDAPLFNQSSNSGIDIAELKKTIKDEFVDEMKEIIDNEVHAKLKKVIGKLGEIVPDFKDIDVEELCADVYEGESEDAEDENGVHDD